MRPKILFLQLEVFLDCAPHMGMCLFIDDLRKAGIQCTAYLVNCNHMDEICLVIEKGDFSLICLDSSFTVDLINELLARFPRIPILVGGVNALTLFLHTEIPFAVFGPGRKAASEFMAQFFGARDFAKVTNLFFKVGDQIHYSGRTAQWDLPSEFFPYKPHLDWQYLGPQRKGRANTEAVSIVAGTGCPHCKSFRSSIRYDLPQAVGRLGYGMTETAFKRLDKIFNRATHGCSFCVFQLQEHTVYPVSKTTEMLIEQAHYLSTAHDTRAFCIQTENPFPFLNRFLDQLTEKGIPVDFVSIRTRPDTLLKQESRLRKALDTAQANDFHFSIEEIGFESFFEEELRLFNKGVSAETNLKALELLRKIKKTYREAVSVHVGHGIILFHPWTTPESMTVTLEVMARYPDVFPRFYPNRLTLYSEFLPLFDRVAAERLAVKADTGYGWDFTPRDPVVEGAFELYTILYSAYGPDIPIAHYLNAVRLLGHQPLEQILEEGFGLVPAEE
jgi:hypothetical protein